MAARARSTHRTPVCLCGARLRWVRYTPIKADPDDPTAATSVLPLDHRAAAPGSPAARTANYAVQLGTVFARQITPTRPLDPAVEWGPFNIHFATCPRRVTAEQLASMGQRNGRRR
ncbi:hypothetical protein [Cellulomonas uda]|uniref:Uncharacterized protein n=1 Tax=Cellulomonas uda TaxID=1714 RepID=A0A4Y3K7N7_CELUD|nr:hypothetical protein [Cellulomonas uda]NII67796.1 hypothetical protein [Cellulomonas uda]GEA79957.1 hypothetical protein CUD01_04010 [Cellulomonas uda]